MAIKLHKTSRHLAQFFVVLGALLTQALVATPAYAQDAGTLIDIAGGSYEGIDVVLAADRAAQPGDVITLRLTATPRRDAPDLTVTWELPDGGLLEGGPAVAAVGAVAAAADFTTTRQVRFAKAGVYAVRAQATYHPNAATTLTAVGVLFFDVRAEGATVSDGDPRIVPYTPPVNRPTIDKSSQVVAADAWESDAPAGCFYVTGILTRGERQPAANPPRYVDVGGSAAPVRNILVEMREEDTFSDDSYGYTVTDANGKFEFRFCDDDGVLNDELELYTRVCAEVWEGPTRIARIEAPSKQELYCFDSRIIDSEGGTVDFDLTAYPINSLEAPLFNIADSLYWAWKYWNSNLGNGAPLFDRGVTVYWEPGRKARGSFYSDVRSAMVIADDASSADEWDDSVIIHEWTHFADHQFSCNQNPGGPHTLPGLNTGMNGDKLSWGEGFADYYQSAARTLMPGSGFTSFYIDVNGPTVDFETLPGTASPLNEAAIAAMLWDFLDTVTDGSDTISHGQARIQKAFTDPGFQGNTQCNMARFLTVWKNLSFPTDAATAATVVQNVNIATPFAVAAAANAESPAVIAAPAAVTAAAPNGYRWWDHVTMVIDNSSSMAGPPGTPKIEAVKALIREQVNDLTQNPLGTRFDLYTFNAGGAVNGVLGVGKFFAAQIDPLLSGLAAAGPDAGCPVRALDALLQAAENQYDGQAWVYTDGDAQPSSSVGYMQQQLNNRLVSGSIVLLGGCNSAPTVQSNVSGQEKNYLGLAADGSQPGGIVPYLLTALGTGGQFFYVAPDQLANATDILRAQASHSAGAGRWSDYVSNNFTYRWDRLTPDEYRWIPSSVMSDAGQLYPSPPLRLNLPQPVSFYGVETSTIDVSEDGFLRMNPCLSNPVFCTLFREYANVLNKDLAWTYIDPGPRTADEMTTALPQEVSETGPQVHVYHGGLVDDQWYIISTEGQGYYGGSDVARRAYQVWLNVQTGEIRYLYDAVRNTDAAGATISVSELGQFGSSEVIVSNQDLAGAVSGSGYKFTPAPPQPTKSYMVAVDGQIESMGFLQTGYSGSLAPMIVRYPDGTPVDCADSANVLCLSQNNGLLQYVQVNINGRTGDYTAEITVGATGEATFSFNALAASPIQPRALGKRTLSLNAQALHVDFGRPSDDGMLTGWLQTPTGARFGSDLAFYDDGAHGDDLPDDGIFGSDALTPPGPGVAYLWLQGTVAGETIKRSDPAPFNFQPIDVQPQIPYIQGFLGSPVAVGFAVTNQTDAQRCYGWEVSVPPGWSFGGSSGSPVCVGAGATAFPSATFSRPLDAQPGGAVGDVAATFSEINGGSIVGGASATVALYRPLTSVAIDNRWSDTYLRPNSSDTISLTVNLLDDQGQISGWSGSLGYQLSTTLGTVTSPTDGAFENGRLPLTFTAGDQTGEAQITFLLEGGSTASTTVSIRSPFAAALELVATPADLRDGPTTSALVATVLDAWGDPVAGQTVRLSVSDDDGSEGTIDGGEVITATTDAAGQVTATFTVGDAPADSVAVRAEALLRDGDDWRVTQEDVVLLTLAGAPSGEERIYLPVIPR